MSNEIETIGLGMDTSGVEKGIKALDVLAGKGVPVEKAMGQIEGAAAKTGKTLASLGQGSGAGLKKVGDEAGKTGGQLADMGGKAKSAGDQLGNLGKQGTSASGGVTQAGKAANQSAADFSKMASAATGAGSSLAAAAGAAAGLFAGLSIAGTVGKVVAVQREFDILNSSLKTVAGGSAAAEREMAWLKQFAKDTPFGLAQATQGFVKMKALGLDPTRASLTSFGNTASAMGKNLNQMVEAVADASTGEFERLKEFGIKAKVEGDKVALTFQGVTKTIENSAKDITKYLEDIGNVQFGGAMAERAKTLDGAIAGLGDTWDELFRTISSNGAGTLIYDSVTAAAGAIEDATAILKAFNSATDDASGKTGAFKVAQEGLALTLETVAILAANVSFVLKTVGREIGGIAAQFNALEIGPAELANPAAAAAKAMVSLAKGRGEIVAQISRDMKADAEAARRDVDALTERILNARKAQEELGKYKTRNDGAATDPRRVDLGKDTSAQDANAAKKAEADLMAIRQKLYGQDKDYLPTLAKLQAAKEARTITEKEYIALVSDLATKNYKASGASKDAASAAKAEQNAYTSLVASIREKTAANQLEISGGEKLTESQKIRVKLDQDLATGKLKLGSLSERQVRAELKLLEASEKEVQDYKEAIKLATDRQALRNKETDGIEAWTKAQEAASIQSQKSIEDRIAGLANEEEAAQLARDTNITLAEAIERVAIARLREKRDGPTGAYKDSPAYKELTDEIELRERLAGGIGGKDAREKSDEAAKKVRDEWERTAQDINSSLTDAFVSSFQSGESLGKNLARSLKDIFANTVLRPIISAVMSPISGGINALVSGVTGTGGGSNLLGLASNGYSLYNGASSAYTLGSQYLGGTMSGANALGSVYANAMGTGIDGLLATNAAFGTSAQSAIAANLAMEAGTAPALAAGTNAAGAAGASGIGSFAAGGIAAAIMLAVINILGGMRSETMIGSGLAGTLGGDKALTPWQEWREGGTLLSGPEFATHNPLEDLASKRAELQAVRDRGDGATNYAVGLQAIVTDLEKTTKGLAEQTEVFNREIGKGYKAYLSNVMDMADSLGLAGSSIEDFAYTLGAQDLNFQGLNPEQIQAKIAETFGKAGDAATKTFLGSWKEVTDTVINTYVSEQQTQASDGAFVTDTTVTKRMEYQASVYAKTGETAIDTLTRLATSFNTLNEASDALGFGIQKGSLALADFSDKFIEAFGGLEKFTASTGAFLQNYYTDTERRDYLIRSGVRQAEKLGIQGLTEDSLRNGSREQFRDFVNSAATNPELYADALDLANYLSPIFASFEEQAPVVQELSNVVDELTQAYQNAVKSLKGDADSLAVELLRAQGNESGAKALERTQYLAQFAGLDEARRKEIETLYDGNMATRAYIQGIKDAATAQLDALAKLRADSLALIDGAAGKTDAAFAAYERAADKERERLQGTIDTIKSVFQAAQDGAKSFFSEVEAVAKFQGAEGRDFISQALASVQAGGALPDGEKLSDAIAAVGKDFSTTQYASQAEADFQRLVVANELKGLQDISGDQLTEAEKQLEALDEQTKWAREQVDALRGIDSKLKTLPEAIADLITAYETEARTRADVGAKTIIGKGPSAVYDKASGSGTTSSGVYFERDALIQAAQETLAANPNANGANSVYDALASGGFTLAQYNDMFGMPPGTLEAEARALGRPIFHSGTTRVPETGFALLQKDEAVIPAAYNPWVNGGAGAGNNAEVVAELRAARGELLEMRKQLDTLNYQTKRAADATNGQGEAPALVTNV